MLIMALSLCACAKPAEPAAIDLESAGWDAIAEAAEGSTVTFYGWGGDENRNNWLNTTVKIMSAVNEENRKKYDAVNVAKKFDDFVENKILH